jgi:hypothetical protein
MKGRSKNGKSHSDGVKAGPVSEQWEASGKTDIPKPKKLGPVGGKKAIRRLDKPTRGKADANAYKRGGKCDGGEMKDGGGIHIKPSHKGRLHEDINTPEGKKIPASKLAKAAHSKDPAERKRAVFAENAKRWNH